MPASVVSRHLTAMLRGPLADTFTFGAQSTGCLFDDARSIVEDGTGFEVPRGMRVATIRTAAITGLSEDSEVSVTSMATGTSVTMAYVVRKVLPMEDGLLSRVLVVPADT